MNDISDNELAMLRKQFSILEEFPGPVSIKSHDSRLLYANKYLIEFLLTDDWLQKTPLDLYAPEFAQGVVDSDKRTYEEVSVELEQTAIDRSGKDRYFKTYKFLIQREKGQPFICAISVDTTELVRVREAIRESEVKFRGAFEDAATGMALISLEGNLLRVNLALCEMLGYSEEELMSKGLEAVSHPDEFVPVLADPQLFIEDGVSSFKFEKRYIHREGYEVTTFVNSAIAVDEDNKAMYYVTQIQDISDSKQLEDDLKESERRYRSLFEQNNDAIFILTLDGDYIDVNQSGCDLLRASREDIVSQGWQIRVVDSEHQHRNSIHKQLMRGEKPKIYERTLLRGDGSEVTVEVTVSLVHDEHGTPLYIQSIARDISERKESETKIREIEKRKDLALEGGNMGVWDWTKETGEMTFDQRWYDILGYEEGDIETHVDGWAKLVHPDDIEAEYELWDAHVEGRTSRYSSEHRMKTKSGEWKWVLESGRVVEWSEDGLTKTAAGTIQDITERKKYEIALRENEERYRALFDQSNDAVFILTLDGRILECNQKAAKFLGYSKDELVGQSIYSLIDPEETEDAQKRAEEVRDIGITQLYERTFIKKDGSSIILEINVSLVRDPDGKSLFVQSIARDITDRKIAEQELREREREVRYAKDRAMLYLDLLGHDITNQLQAISAGSEIAKELSNQEEVKKVLDIVAQSTKRCERIIRTVKATEHLMLKQKEEIDLAKLVMQVITSVRERYPEVDFKLSLPKNEFIVLADEYLKVVFTNLLENAIQHNPATHKQVWLQIVEQPAGYAVKISDDGTGISDGVKEALFDIKQRFGGVGLHQSKEIMDKYGGCITISDRVENQPRQGTQFKIWLPKTTK